MATTGPIIGPSGKKISETTEPFTIKTCLNGTINKVPM